MGTATIRLGVVALVAAGLAGSALARDEIVTARGWQQVDYSEAGDCRAEVRTNGQFYQIAGSGYRAGEEVRFHLVNDAVREVNWGEIKPVQYRFKADESGDWSRFYLPFVPNIDGRTTGGNVTISLDSASCSIDLWFEWNRLQPSSWIAGF